MQDFIFVYITGTCDTRAGLRPELDLQPIVCRRNADVVGHIHRAVGAGDGSAYGCPRGCLEVAFALHLVTLAEDRRECQDVLITVAIEGNTQRWRSQDVQRAVDKAVAVITLR